MMTELIHGGDWAGYELEYGKAPLDFSASISPLGLPESVRKAVLDALEHADRYPDPQCRALRQALSEFHDVECRRIVCGSGASDLIDRICRTLRPRHAAVFVPGFSEYERGLLAEGCEVSFIHLPESENFRITQDMLKQIPQNCELLFLCNPNNPTGVLTEADLLHQILICCRETKMHLVVDECFLDLTSAADRYSLIGELSNISELIILKAFTKLYAMAGLRLGYALCGSEALADRLERCGQPWPVSDLAQTAGIAALRETDYTDRVRSLINEERLRMRVALEKLGLHIIPGEANYLLFESGDALLAAKMRARGILIRDCRSFRGLHEGWYRIAIRTREENDILLRNLREVTSNG